MFNFQKESMKDRLTSRKRKDWKEVIASSFFIWRERPFSSAQLSLSDPHVMTSGSGATFHSSPPSHLSPHPFLSNIPRLVRGYISLTIPLSTTYYPLSTIQLSSSRVPTLFPYLTSWRDNIHSLPFLLFVVKHHPADHNDNYSLKIQPLTARWQRNEEKGGKTVFTQSFHTTHSHTQLHSST